MIEQGTRETRPAKLTGINKRRGARVRNRTTSHFLADQRQISATC